MTQQIGMHGSKYLAERLLELSWREMDDLATFIANSAMRASPEEFEPRFVAMELTEYATNLLKLREEKKAGGSANA